MILVLLTVTFMWGFQIYFMEQNYIHSSITEVEEELAPILEELAETDLAQNEQMISYLTSTAQGKVMIVGKDGELIAFYSYN